MSVRCLIVDDNRDFLRVATELLERGGIAVVGVASTGPEACQTCAELQPDVVLVDIDLGEESGFEVARQLAGQVGRDQPLVILMSAHSAEDLTDMVADSPAGTFLLKEALSGPAVLKLLAGAGAAHGERRYRDSR
jgi:two-component system, NarL family, nitrate/nitrite response regulator NarL